MDGRRRAHLRFLVAATIVALAALAAPATTTAQPAFSVLHSFAGGTDGANSPASLIQATDGNFYGVTNTGGNASGDGTVFKMTPTGTVTNLHIFAAGADGSTPNAALIQATDGNFYGTTWFGGASDAGTAFKMTPAGTVTVLHAFAGGTDGANPAAALIQATDGNFYGTTLSGGGTPNNGTVFRMTPAGTVIVLHAFAGGTDGANPEAALIQATDGNFYGTTLAGGGTPNNGTVFKMTPAGTVTILHAFAGGTDGSYSNASLIQATDGNFYGTTENGGNASSGGTVFVMTPAGTVTVLHAFVAATDGANPPAALFQATDGNFYGMTWDGGASSAGTFFKMTSAGTFTVLHAFDGTSGANPGGSFIKGTGGGFYGTTTYGGSSLNGVVFEFTLAPAPTMPTALRIVP